MMDKVASLEEMQMEIDCMTKASLKANVRAAKGREAAHPSIGITSAGIEGMGFGKCRSKTAHAGTMQNS